MRFATFDYRAQEWYGTGGRAIVLSLNALLPPQFKVQTNYAVSEKVAARKRLAKEYFGPTVHPELIPGQVRYYPARHINLIVSLINRYSTSSSESSGKEKINDLVEKHLKEIQERDEHTPSELSPPSPFQVLGASTSFLTSSTTDGQKWLTSRWDALFATVALDDETVEAWIQQEEQTIEEKIRKQTQKECPTSVSMMTPVHVRRRKACSGSSATQIRPKQKVIVDNLELDAMNDLLSQPVYSVDPEIERKNAVELEYRRLKEEQRHTIYQSPKTKMMIDDECPVTTRGKRQRQSWNSDDEWTPTSDMSEASV
ncbi:hypothetical protein BLNAU_166 [Blattamonas nauphoetae]|uniref:Uncharacterized protein n=1 Tax=Blattamonas nauphoetae TaxID=2049346 RepID=A0ABQ9YMF8_9EUKA|nr:hypothetical protein BLNAU_166 [Blattamonas nauphoetae]